MYNTYTVSAYAHNPRTFPTHKRAIASVEALRSMGYDATLTINVVNPNTDSSYVLQTFQYDAK